MGGDSVCTGIPRRTLVSCLPAFEGTLSDEQILDVAAFVVESGSGGGATAEETG